MLIDCETHVFSYCKPYPGTEFNYCKAEHLLSDMDRCGVDKTILMSYSPEILGAPDNEFRNPGCLGPDPVKYMIESWQKHKGRFFWFSVPDPRRDDCIEILKRQMKLGLQGLGEVLPVYQNILPDGPELMQIYSFAAENNLPVVLALERWDWPQYSSFSDFDIYFDMVEGIIRKFPSVRFMLDHGGNCGTIVRTPDFRQYAKANIRCWKLAAEVDNLWVCSCMPWWFSDGEPHSFLVEQLNALKTIVAPDKICWGSDWPYMTNSFNCDYSKVVDAYKKLGEFTENERDMLLGKSAYNFITGE